VKLFCWARETFAQRLKNGLKPETCSGLLMTRLLSIEGVRDDLKVEVPKDLLDTLTAFRRLRSDARERKAEQLLKEWAS
jgi:hypothetical protein